MALSVFIPDRYESRYSLLGAMSREIAGAMRGAGAEINPSRPVRDGEPTLHVFFNLPQSYEQFVKWVQPQRRGAVVIQFFVDHPLAISAEFLDKASELRNFRLALPCVDDRAVLALKWPGLRCVTCAHGVPAEALCDAASIGTARRNEIVVAGTIATEEELAKLRERVPDALRAACDDAAALMASTPSISFLQAFDLCIPPGLHASDHWVMLQMCSRYAVARANRTRRLATLGALRGLPVAVHGGDAWREHCTGTIEYRGEIAYDRLPEVLRGSSVALAWNPTQFTHSFSERILLSMAAGCATLTEDRPLVRREFCTGEPSVECFDAASGESVRSAAEGLLKDGGRALALAKAGRASVERSHLWKHRVDLLGQVVVQVLREQGASL